MDIKRIFVLLCMMFLFVAAGCSTKQTPSNGPTGNNNTNSGSSIVIYAVQPASAYAGAGINITGTGFGSTRGTVKFGNAAAPVKSWSDTSIGIAVPDIAAGTVKISVAANNKTSNTMDFTILPFVSGISKTDTILNDTVAINGTGFGASQAGSTVNYAGTVLPVKTWSANLIKVLVGNINRAVSGQLSISINNTTSNGITFTVHPHILGLTPNTAERGSRVDINGNLFGSTQGASNVTFSGITATVIDWSDNFIRTEVPDTAVKGDIVIAVSGISSVGRGFTVTKTFYSINRPTGFAMDNAGNMYVANYADGTIIEVLPGGITQTTIYKGLKNPLGLYYLAPSALFVANEGDGTIQRLTLGSTVTGYTFASGFSRPAGIAMDDTGDMYVTNSGNNTISKISLGGVVSVFAASTYLNKPMGIVFTGPSGGKTFMVVNSGNGTISNVTLSGVVAPPFISGLVSPKYIISDRSGNLYITSDNKIIKILLPSGITFTYAIGLSNPYGLAMDSSGEIYADNFSTNSVSKVSNTYQVYAQGLYNPWGITFSSSGSTMFIVNQGSLGGVGGGSISMVTADGGVYPFVAPLDQSSCFSGPPNPQNSMMPTGITVGFNGDLFVSSIIMDFPWGFPGAGGSSISDVTYTGSASVFGNCSIYFSLYSPYGLAFSSARQLLYVADGSGRIFTETSSGSHLYNFASGFNSPKGIALDASGNVYIANSGGGTISSVTAGGTVITTYASGFNSPSGIAFDNSGNLYVSNQAGDSVSVVAPSHRLYNIASGIPSPTGITVGNDGYIYVASQTEGKVYKLIHPTTTYISGFRTPTGITRGKDGMIYIADKTSNNIYLLNGSGAITTFADNIASPSWFAFDSTGATFLSDFSSNTIIKLSGNNIGVFAAGLNGPEGIAYDTLNNLIYVGNYLDGTLSIINNAGNISAFAVGLSGPMGVALLSPGNLYVANSSNGTIAKVVQGSGVSLYAAGFGLPIGIALDAQHNLYVADQSAGLIYLISPDAAVSIFANVNTPYGVGFDGNGNLFVSDSADKQIKEIILK